MSFHFPCRHNARRVISKCLHYCTWFLSKHSIYRFLPQLHSHVDLLWRSFFANEFNRSDTVAETVFNPFFVFLANCSHIMGPILVFVIILLLGSVLLIFYLCLLPQRYFESRGWALWHFLVSHYLLAHVVYHYFKAAFTHPGRVPSGAGQPLQWVSSICRRCILPRPPRAHHCGVCGECILCMDHHCPWINNCVGYRNHRHFFMLLVSLFIACVYAWFVACPDFRSHYATYHADKGQSVWLHWFISYLLLLTGILTAFVGGLLLWHARLISRGETSIEVHLNKKARLRFAKRGLVYSNPYNFGFLGNWRRFLGLRRDHVMWDILTRLIIPSRHAPIVGGNDGTLFEMALLDCDKVMELLTV